MEVNLDTSKPAEKTQAPTTSTSGVAQTASIGCDPLKYVAPSLCPVKPPTTSLIPRLTGSVSSLPMLL